MFFCIAKHKFSKMLKQFTTVFLFTFLAALAAVAQAEPSDELKNLMACGNAAQTVTAQCTADLPPMVKNTKNFDFLKSHPEMCCPTYQAFVCVEEGLFKLDACKKVWNKMKLQMDEQMRAFPAVGCNVQKCKKEK